MEGATSASNPKQNQSVAARHSTSYNLFILILTIFSLLVAAGLIIRPVNDGVLVQIDFLICMVFLIDFGLNLWRAPGRADYFFMRGGWLDLLGSIPAVPGLPLTPLLRLARLNQLVRIAKHLWGHNRAQLFEESRQDPAKTALLTMIIAAFVLITVVSLSIVRLERGATQANIKTGPDAFWWAMATITTVGYGDYVPVTYFGRLLALVLMIFGIGIFAVLTSLMAARVVRLRDDQEEVAAIVREENALIRAELAEIKALLKQKGMIDDDETC